MPDGTKPRKTKITCTLGPASSSPDKIARLIRAGMDVARLNFSHGDHASHRQAIADLRQAAQDAGRPVGILQDLAGPKIRLGLLPQGERLLAQDEEITLVPVPDGGEAPDPDALPVNYPYLIEDVEEGESILLADGLVELRVRAKRPHSVLCRVVVPGLVSSRKGVNLPASSLRIPTFTEKDLADLTMGLEEQVDFVAMSFVRHEKDLTPIRDLVAGRPFPPLIIAKIEKPQAVERLESILKVVDGVMVARGDLGVEMPLEQVPIIQKQIISQARRAGKVVITATQMLRSMMSSPRPTRAEATDVANAVLDGTDAVMLSDETAVGNYPVQAVQVLDRICRATEPFLNESPFLREDFSPLLPEGEAALTRSACFLARDLDAPVLVATTASGRTARLMARLRPARDIVGLTSHPEVYRQLAMSWGVFPILCREFDDLEHMTRMAKEWVQSQGLAQDGQKLVITCGYPLNITGTTNMLKVVGLP
ncbi:MAG: pyruvate kinase [Deltaproteobacteria bacterium]|nr:pyruvate kinase [Deltaproteobacteria bacterium]